MRNIMNISIIAAMTKNRVIGKNNQLPWHLPEDLRHFKEITMGHPIIMGRKTFESIGKPLQGRKNIVLTRNEAWSAEGVESYHHLDDVMAALCNEEEIFIIGGAEIFKTVLPKADKLYLTFIQEDISGDTYFPELNLKDDYEIINHSKIHCSATAKLSYCYVLAHKKRGI